MDCSFIQHKSSYWNLSAYGLRKEIQTRSGFENDVIDYVFRINNLKKEKGKYQKRNKLEIFVPEKGSSIIHCFNG